MKATTGKAVSHGLEFIEASRVFLSEDFLPKLLHCVEGMSDEDIWWRPNENSNSIGNLILHLCGNLRQWVVNPMGSGKYRRDRDGEFAARGPVPHAELIAEIQDSMKEVDEVLAALPEARLLVRYPIQAYQTSALQAIYHVVEHFSYHLGQVLYIYKLRTGIDPGFYRDLSTRR